MTDRDALRDRLDDLEGSVTTAGDVCDGCGRPTTTFPSVTAEFVHYGCVCDLDHATLFSA